MKPWKFRYLAGVCVSATVALMASPAMAVTRVAVGKSSSTQREAAAMGTSLTMAISAEPQSLDPSKDDNGDGLFATELLYAPLVNETDQGTYTPALATSWHYVGTGNKKFELTIRNGAKFSDGEPVTASAVAASLLYNAKGSGPAGSDFVGLTATASGDNVLLTVKVPVANFPEILSQRNLVGDIVCPASLKTPQSLAAQPCGAGPYVLDSSATIPGNTYVFTPDADYYDPSQIHYKTITIKVISDPTSQLDAVRTGQVQVLSENDTTLEELAPAKASGLQVDVVGETQFVPVWIMDRDGNLDKALGNVLVRQALNYDVNRAAIAKAVFGALGAPDDEPATPGWDGYDPALANYYAYNPAKAKKLLIEAGYPNGFSMTDLYVSSQTAAQTALEALKQDWSAIGVQLDLVPEPDLPAFSAVQATKKYPAFTLQWGSGDISGSANLLWASHTGANAFYATPPAFLRLFDAAEGASPANSQKAFQAMDSYVIKQAWYVTVCASKAFIIAAKGLKGLPPTNNPQPASFNLLEVHN